MAYEMVQEDDFAAFAKRSQEEAEQNNKRTSGGQTFQRNFETVKWVSIPKAGNGMRVIRIVGAPPVSIKPGMKQTPDGAHEIFVSKVLDDSGKRITLRLPLHADDPMHESLMWNIINTVKAVSWIPSKDPAKKGKNDKVFKYEKYPWFNKVVHGGFDPSNPKDEINYKQCKGWSGQQVVIMNVIDREDSWCKDNKHTKLLTKKIGTSEKDGVVTEWPEVGVPSFGFVSQLSTIWGQFGSFEKYDVGVSATGQMSPAYTVTELTPYKKANLLNKIPSDKVDLVSLNEFLTEEELNYERYDIGKFFAPTTYNQIMKHFGNTIKAIDADLNKNFYEQLQSLVEQEKERNKELYGDNNEVDAPTPNDNEVNSTTMTESVATSTDTTTTVTRNIQLSKAALSAEKISYLKGWNKLSESEKDAITDVIIQDGKVVDITYDSSAGSTVACTPEDGGCGIPSPATFAYCPCCGAQF